MLARLVFLAAELGRGGFHIGLRLRRRGALALLTVALGVSLAASSYFFLAAPLGRPAKEAFSNPRIPSAAGLFIVGVVLVFLSAVVYELLPERKQR
ncbi:MAG: hypothetical protein HY684_06535 [Chloroflexi bacterium]|nr:hypothetical protein [Chloroflexota bacterium]